MTVICLDEVAPLKGHGHYYLIISAPELGVVLDVLKDRKKETLLTWFDQRGPDWCAAIEVCCGMPTLKPPKRNCPMPARWWAAFM